MNCPSPTYFLCQNTSFFLQILTLDCLIIFLLIILHPSAIYLRFQNAFKYIRMFLTSCVYL